jgi:hypothetical protein
MTCAQNPPTLPFLQSLNDYLKELNGAQVSGSSELAKQISDLQAIATDSALSEAQKYEAAANLLHSQYQDYAQAARDFAARADASADARLAEIFNRNAEIFQNVANERQVLGDAAWANKVAQDNSLALRNVSSGWDAARAAGEVAGPALDGVQTIMGWYEGIATGNWDALGKTSSEILGSSLGGLAVGAVVAPLVAAGGLPFLIGAGLIGAAAYAGSKIGGGMWEKATHEDCPPIDPTVSNKFTWAQRIPFRRDPLTLDLNGWHQYGATQDTTVVV